MKFFTLGLAVATVGLLSTAGCSSPATTEPAAETPVAATSEAPAPEAPAETAAAPESKPAPKAASYKGKADPKYKVVDVATKFGPDAPSDLVKALNDAAVPPPPLDFKMAAKPRIVLNTSKGAITVELDPKAAPLHAKSFVYLSSIGFFNGTVFHRHADLLGDGTGFIIQGGDPFTKKPELKEAFGQGGPGYEIPREVNKLKHDKLVIAAARSNDPNSAGSQFYITQGPVHFLDEGYTVFGKVVAGNDAALKLTQDDTLKSATVQK